MPRKPAAKKPSRTNRARPAAPAWKRRDDRAAKQAAARSGLEQLRRLAYRYRWQLAPIYAAAVTYVAAGIAHKALPPALLVLIVAIGAAVTISIAHKAFPRKSEQLYASAVVLVTAAWLVPAAVVGPKVRPLPGILLVITLAAGIPWWSHRRVRDHIVTDRQQEAWPAVMEAAGLAGAKLRQVRTNKNGWTGVLHLKAGQTAADVSSSVPKLESAMGVRPNAVRTQRDPKAANKVKITVVITDVFGGAGEIPHPATLGDGWEPASRSIMDLCTLGRREDGELGGYKIVDKNGAHHTLIGGQKGSGKSGVLSVILAHIAACNDAVMIGVDLAKGGRVFAPWRDCMYYVATTMAEAKAIVAALNEIIEDRARVGAELGESDKTTPSPDLPAIGFIVDEGAKLLGTEDYDAIIGTRDTAQGGRSEAVFDVIATQRPTLSSLGDGDLRAQLDVNIGLKMRAKADVRFVFPDNWEQFDTSLFDLPGMLYLEAGDADPTPMRSFALYHPPIIRKVSEQLAPGRPKLDARAAAIFDKHLAPFRNGQAPAPAATPAAAPKPKAGREGNGARRAQLQAELAEVVDELEVDGLPAVELSQLQRPTPVEDASGLPVAEVLEELRKRKLEADEADAAIVAEIRRHGSDGARMHHLVAVAQLHRSRVYARLAPLEQAGIVAKAGRGAWTAPAVTKTAA
jgi:S-DNA-T family DNA segregation ATPase FtsK/SpoIIIE